MFKGKGGAIIISFIHRSTFIRRQSQDLFCLISFCLVTYQAFISIYWLEKQGLFAYRNGCSKTRFVTHRKRK